MNIQKRMWLAGSLCMLLCLCFALSASAAFNPFYTRSQVSNLRVRSTPKSSASAFDYLDKDQLAWATNESYEKDTRFYFVEYIDKRGVRQTGWIVSYDGNTGYVYDLTQQEMDNLSYKDGALPNEGSSSGSTSGDSSSTGDTSSGSSSGDTSSGTSSSSNKYANTYLKLGSKGTVVREMQQKLKDLKMYSGDVTGTFGTITENAVKAYQKKLGLTADGVAGPATLNALLGSGSSSSSNNNTSTTPDASDLAITIKDKVNYRSGPGTSNSSKSILPINTVFTILSKTTKDGYTWYEGQLSGSRGYVRNDMMRVLTAEEASNYKAGNSITATPSPDATPDPNATPTPTPNTNTTSGMARITASNVNVRSGSDTKSASLAKAQRNDVFDIGNSQNSGGVLWYYLTSTKVSGWVHGNYVHVMTQAEIDAYNSANSGSSGSGDTDTGTSNYRLLKLGSTGSDVTRLQETLKSKGYYTGTVSGSYGTLTQAAVRDFQSKNGLYVDGIAGENTQAKLYGTSTDNNSGGGSSGGTDVTTPTINGVEMLDWSVFKSSVTWANGAKAVLTDVRSGKSFNIVKQSAGNHLDVEPASANDTAIMKQIYGGTITYVRRPVWITIGTRTFAGSMYGVAHGAQTVKDNNFNGQFCIHMLNSRNHVAGAVDDDHQAAVREAYNAATNKI